MMLRRFNIRLAIIIIPLSLLCVSVSMTVPYHFFYAKINESFFITIQFRTHTKQIGQKKQPRNESRKPFQLSHVRTSTPKISKTL